MTRKLKAFLELIKFEHSIFALPFAYLGLFLAEGGLPRFRIFFWMTLAMIAIRTAGMCLNRLIDQPIDEKNPRTRARIPLMNLVSRGRVWGIAIGAIGIFVYSASRLNPFCLALSPIPVFLVWIYPYLKKITWASHFILGIILGMAPAAGWLSARPEWSLAPVILMLAVACWVSGFDMFYALQDVGFDRANRLKSFPAAFGTERTIQAVRFLHGLSLLALGLVGIGFQMGLWYWAGWAGVTGLIVREHRLVARFGLAKIDEAFFNMNAWVSVVIFLAVALDLTLHS